MDVSGTSTIHLDHARVAARREALAARAGELGDERRRIDQAVESLLPGWRGAAADSFRARWEEWRDGADGVIGELVTSIAALDLACADLATADGSADAVSARLGARLGGGLG